MAILTEEQHQMSSQTFEKSIDANAMQMMLDILQKNQYRFPQKSSIREIASNAVDALNERNVARQILKGRAKVEDFYLARTDGVFSDSVFDREYYDLAWLSTEDKVYIQYFNNGNMDRDELVIRDYGVGLWGKRLMGYFNLGYSTKRNSKFALGKFGIGAKSALSTGVPYFTVTTRYNGKRTSFNVYGGNIEPIVPHLNMRTGEKNPWFDITFGTQVKRVFYESTTEKNGIDITLQVKKHHKTLYMDAVKSQLMYFPEIQFEEYTGTMKVQIPTLAKILYEDEAMIISDNPFHNKPHLLIDKVNYGNIDFTELELEDKKGGIGIKVKAEDVTVNPSRETVIWDDNTKQSILDAFNRVIDSASKRIEKELQETNLIRWYRACVSTMSGYRGGDPALVAMTRIISFEEIRPAFSGNPEITWAFPFMDFLSFTTVTTNVVVRGSEKVKKLDRSSCVRGELFGARPIIRRFKGVDDSDARKNKYISSVLYPQGYQELVIPASYEDNPRRFKHSVSELAMDYAVRQIAGKKIKGTYRQFSLTEAYREVRDKVYEIADYITLEWATDTEVVIDYSSIVVPPTFKSTESEDEVDKIEEDKAESVKLEESISAADRRNMKGTTLVFTPRRQEGKRTSFDAKTGSYQVPSLLTMTKVEIDPRSVDSWNSEEIFFCSKEDEEMLHMAALISRPIITKFTGADGKGVTWEKQCEVLTKEFPHESYQHDLAQCNWMHADNVKFIMVSKENARYYRDFKQIQQFFMDVRQNTLTMATQLVKWNTARLMNKTINRMRFLEGFGSINPELTLFYKDVRRYCGTHYVGIDSNVFGNQGRAMTDLAEYLDSVGNFQHYVRENPEDTDGIANMARAMLNPAEGVSITDARAIDMDIFLRYREVLDMVEGVYTLLNECPLLTETKDGSRRMDVFVEQEVRSYITHKGADILFTHKPIQ